MAGSTSEYRVVIEAVRPTVECGRFAAKAAAGLPLEVSADIFADGHDQLMAVVRHGPPPAGAAPPPVRRWPWSRWATTAGGP